MDWEEVQASLERKRKPSSRNFREIVKMLVELEPRVLEHYAIPYLLECFQDWPLTTSRVVPPDLRDRVRARCAEVALYQLVHPPDLDLIPVSEWQADLGAQLSALGVAPVSMRCTAAELELMYAELPRTAPLVYHGDLTITDGELPGALVVTGSLTSELPEPEPEPVKPPAPLPPRNAGPADLNTARWVAVADILPYLDTPSFAEHRGHFADVLLGTDFSDALVIPGDVTIDGDFDHAWLEKLGRDPSGTVVVIDGNLSVSGDVCTAHGAGSARVCLVVIGDVTCRTFYCGRTYLVAVAGVARCEEGMFALNDHCPLFFADLHAPVAMFDEYWLMGGTQNVDIVTCRDDAGAGHTWPDLDQHITEVFAPELIADSGALDQYEVLAWIRKGRDIRRP